MRKSSIDRSARPSSAGPGEQRRRRVDGEGAGGRRDRCVGRGWSVGRRRGVLGLRRLGAGILVPVRLRPHVWARDGGAVVRGLRSRRRRGVVVRRSVTGGGVRGRRRGRRDVGRRMGAAGAGASGLAGAGASGPGSVGGGGSVSAAGSVGVGPSGPAPHRNPRPPSQCRGGQLHRCLPVQARTTAARHRWYRRAPAPAPPLPRRTGSRTARCRRPGRRQVSVAEIPRAWTRRARRLFLGPGAPCGP